VTINFAELFKIYLVKLLNKLRYCFIDVKFLIFQIFLNNKKILDKEENLYIL